MRREPGGFEPSRHEGEPYALRQVPVRVPQVDFLHGDVYFPSAEAVTVRYVLANEEPMLSRGPGVTTPLADLSIDVMPRSGRGTEAMRAVGPTRLDAFRDRPLAIWASRREEGRERVSVTYEIDRYTITVTDLRRLPEGLWRTVLEIVVDELEASGAAR